MTSCNGKWPTKLTCKWTRDVGHSGRSVVTMNVKPIRVATAVALGSAAFALAAAPSVGAAPSPLPRVCVVAGEAVACPSPAPIVVSNFPGAVHLYPYGYLPAPIAGQR